MHDDVEPPPASHGLGHQFLDVPIHADIVADGERLAAIGAHALGDCLCRFQTTRADDDTGTGRGEGFDDAEAEIGGGTGHDGDATFEGFQWRSRSRAHGTIHSPPSRHNVAPVTTRPAGLAR